MKFEIERKFLVADPSIIDRAKAPPRRLRQGYLSSGPGTPTVRVRLSPDVAWLTIKGPMQDYRRLEYEYEVPVADGHDLLDHLTKGTPVEKDRYLIEDQGFVWEVDVFVGANAPLITAEVELEQTDTEVPLPAWLGDEVSDDPRYNNARLAEAPFGRWES